MLESRFSSDIDIFEIIQPFIQLKENANIRQIHTIFGADLQLATLHLEFQELVQLKLWNELSLTDLIKKLIEPNNLSKYENVATILCRINACTPQSADAERSIKANNLFKTAFRTRLNLETENNYMFVYFNMPCLELWSPREAILSWLKAKDRREHSNLLHKETAKNQSYYKGIFEMAGESDDDEEGHGSTQNQNIAF